MKRFINHIMVAGVLLLGYSCAEPSEPTQAEMLPGSWEVVDYYVNGQLDAGSNIFERFILERNGTFVLEDQNSIFFAGDWSASDNVLTLTASDGSVFTYSIIFLSFEKMQVVQSFSNPTAGDIEIRYLMNRFSADRYDQSGS